MATRKRKQVKKYKFELTRGAIGGIAVVCFCIFLWMFLFGVWTGQSLLQPASLQLEQGDELEGPVTQLDGPVMQLDEQSKHRPQ